MYGGPSLCVFPTCAKTQTVKFCSRIYTPATITDYLIHDLLLQLHHGLSKHGYITSLFNPAKFEIFAVVLLPIPSLAGCHVVSLGKQLTNVENFFPSHTV
jgi:hypothetical protein